MTGYTTLNFHGVDVKFPYEPYPAQEEYIKKCVEALVNRNHAVLESPTGTGKTLCLLASVIAFRQWAKRNPRKNKFGGTYGEQGAPKIIYASRTHSQLTQVVSELRKLRDVCGYQVDMTVVGGRSSLCVDLDVKKITNSSEQQNACRAKRNGKDGCGPKKEADKLSGIAHTRPDVNPAPKPQKFTQFAAPKNAPDMLKAAQDEAERKRKHELINSSGVHDIMDIEELVSWCENPPTEILKASYGDSVDCSGKSICGYYLSRAKADTVEILLMPYNYILDTKIRRRNSFEFKNKILILDEAHNVEQVCEESSSHYMSLKKLEIIGKELEMSKISVTKPTTNQMDPNPEFFKPHEIDRYIQNFHDFHFHFQQRVFDDVAAKGKDGMAYKVSDFVDQLIATNMFDTNASRWAALASQVVGHFVKERGRSSGLSGTFLEEFAFMMEDMHRLRKNRNEYENYRIQICEDEFDSADMEIKIWCFNASYSIDSITEGAEGVYNLILTSGTLSPLDEYINSLGLDRPNQLKTIQLMNDHVIDSKQLFVTTLTGTKGAEFHNVFRNRQDKNMFEKYAEVLRDMKEVSPGGMLVFHPTYALMGISKKFWGLDKKKATFENRFNVPVFLEPSNKHDLEKMTESFERELVRDEEKGAIFNGVCRGKMSEGVDFADCRGRVVIITGIPYPPAKDPKVMLKKEYLDNRKKTGKGIIDGNKWYGIEAIRAINQAVGRIIRHKNDFGAIIYMDKRFVKQGYSREAYDLMPSWVKRNHQVLPRVQND